jgi:hypothetical protein
MPAATPKAIRAIASAVSEPTTSLRLFNAFMFKTLIFL